ncbi:MAG: TfoX/Sxy family protein [Deltaproteobacteria bacterium]|nr:TfoX/Sxy family protein [Deltaproteobacteria bacterium]
MAYDEKLAERIRAAVGPRPEIAEKKMFGGIAFLLDGKMFIGVADDKLMVRVGPEAHAKALAEAHALPMDFTGRPMKGYVFVAAAGVRTVAAVKKWTERALAFVATVEAKPKKRPVQKKRKPQAKRP